MPVISRVPMVLEMNGLSNPSLVKLDIPMIAVTKSMVILGTMGRPDFHQRIVGVCSPRFPPDGP